jgi:small subunit ribosomal protein S20
MPIIKSAIKKLKQDRKRKLRNLTYRSAYKKAIKVAKETSGTAKKGIETIKKAVSAIDKAAKKGIIHKKKASRLKSQVSKRKK